MVEYVRVVTSLIEGWRVEPRADSGDAEADFETTQQGAGEKERLFCALAEGQPSVRSAHERRD